MFPTSLVLEVRCKILMAAGHGMEAGHMMVYLLTGVVLVILGSLLLTVAQDQASRAPGEDPAQETKLSPRGRAAFTFFRIAQLVGGIVVLLGAVVASYPYIRERLLSPDGAQGG
jgi:hypothetical protein